jgi:hypothetical protein
VLISCSINERHEQTDNLPDETLQLNVPTLRKIPDDSLLYYSYKIENSEENNTKTHFQSLDDFPNLWAGLSQNALGFFIYHRGKGMADMFSIGNQTISNSGYGETVSWPIREFKKLNDNIYYFGLGSDTTKSTYARCTFEILDLDTLYTIKSTQVYKMTEEGEKLLGQYEGLYIPIYKQYLFYHINEPNRKDPNAWIPTSEIDLKEFKKNKLTVKAPNKTWGE